MHWQPKFTSSTSGMVWNRLNIPSPQSQRLPESRASKQQRSILLQHHGQGPRTIRLHSCCCCCCCCCYLPLNSVVGFGAAVVFVLRLRSHRVAECSQRRHAHRRMSLRRRLATCLRLPRRSVAMGWERREYCVNNNNTMTTLPKAQCSQVKPKHTGTTDGILAYWHIGILAFIQLLTQMFVF